jgi:hypothetical protein
MLSPLVKLQFEEHVRQHMEAMLVGGDVSVPPEMGNPLQGPEGAEQEQQPQPIPEQPMMGQ